MAISNWDTAAWDAEGNPCKGVMETERGVIVSIYKNWVSISEVVDKLKITSIRIQHGEVHYKDVTVVVRRFTKQNAVFVYATGSKKNERLFGIGCYAYDDDPIPTGVKLETARAYFKWLLRLERNYLVYDLPTFKGMKRYNQGDAYFREYDDITTNIGEAEKTVFSRLIEGMKNDNV
jgi:hypothetical protein